MSEWMYPILCWLYGISCLCNMFESEAVGLHTS